MTKSTAINRRSSALHQEDVHLIGHHSAVLAARLRERAASAARGQFGEPPFHSYEEAVLTYGRAFTEALIPGGGPRGRMKLCQGGALRTAFRSAGTESPLAYCDGFALPVELGIVVQHAWLVDRHGRVVDPSWDDADACGYVGVPLTLRHMAPWSSNRAPSGRAPSPPAVPGRSAGSITSDGVTAAASERDRGDAICLHRAVR